MKKLMLFTALISLVLTVKAQQDVMLNGEWQLNIAGKDYVVNVPHTKSGCLRKSLDFL